jgi:hypothetical protein
VIAVIAVIAAVGVANIRGAVSNVAPTSSATGPGAQSSALYCTGLTNNRGGLRGVVTFINTTDATRHVLVHATATGAVSAVATALTLGPFARQSVTPTNLVVGDTYALSAQIDGGGVSGEELVTRHGTQAPCVSEGVTTWYGSGFDTTVGSKATLSVYNPTATAAVFNVTTFSNAGYLAPASLQGVTVGAHSELTLNIGQEVVATANVGVEVSVLQGSLVVVGDQVSGATSSLNVGASTLATSGTFPLVTTANGALAQVRVANPGPAATVVKVLVKLGTFKIAPQSTTIAAYHSSLITITPNTAIPASGEASLSLSATQPVLATLATGTTSGLTFSPLGVPVARAILADVTGGGFGEATLTNASDATRSVNWTLIHNNKVTVTGALSLGVGGTISLGQLVGGKAKLRGATFVATTSTPALVVNAILNTTPIGLTSAAALNGG